MKAYLAIVCLGVFTLMALSNAIVPVLPSFAPGAAWEGAIYAAYFLGAFLFTLPGGILSDRYGRVPVIRTGLFLTTVSGVLLCSISGPGPVIVFRLIEGTGAGLFIAAAMSYINSQPDHTRLSGYYLAMLNAGLVAGLAISGGLAAWSGEPSFGMGVFTLLSGAALIAGLILRETPAMTSCTAVSLRDELREVAALITAHSRLWYSAIVLVGITGVISSLYPAFSKEPADLLGIWIAAMSVATIVTVLVVSRVALHAREAIRWAAVFMAAGALLSFVSPLGFVVLGALAGIVMVAQMTALAGERKRQGLIMGLFSTASYLGMTVLPFIAGIIAEGAGYPYAFLITALFGGTVAVSICDWHCRKPVPAQ